MKPSPVYQSRYNTLFKRFAYTGLLTLLDADFPVLGWHVKDLIDEEVT